MIEVRGVTRKFGEIEALRGIDLTIDKGELFAFIGPDGAGKTTLFRMITGDEQPDSGTLERI